MSRFARLRRAGMMKNPTTAIALATSSPDTSIASEVRQDRHQRPQAYGASLHRRGRRHGAAGAVGDELRLASPNS